MPSGNSEHYRFYFKHTHYESYITLKVFADPLTKSTFDFQRDNYRKRELEKAITYFIPSISLYRLLAYCILILNLTARSRYKFNKQSVTSAAMAAESLVLIEMVID